MALSRRWFLAGLAAAIATVGVSADARMHAPYRGHRIVPANAAPLDGFTTPSGAYSFRKLRTAYTGPAVKLQRVDTTTQDIGFTATGDFDTAAAAAFCTTACAINTMYDQSGNGRHLVQATAASQPGYLASCIAGKPCMQALVGAQSLSTVGSITPATGILALNAVAERITGTGGCTAIRQNGAVNRLMFGPVAGQWQILGSVGGITVGGIAEAAWHSGTGVFNGASSVLSVDGSQVANAVTGGTAAGQTLAFSGSGTATCAYTEAVHWDNYALTAGEIAALAQNQRDYWMLPLDGFTAPSGAYSFRKLRSAYAGSAVRLRRASDNLEADIGFLGCTSFTGCPIDMAAANAHCAATTCFGRTWYDQSGAARDLVQATAANQPQLIFACKGTLPCWQYTANTQVLQASATITPATGTVSFSAVGQRSGGIGSFSLIAENAAAGNRVAMAVTTDTWGVYGGTSGNVAAAGATEGGWHALNAVMAGAASVVSIDGVETTGTATGNVNPALTRITGAPSPTVANEVEAVFWDNYSLTPAERAVLVNNQRGFWGF